VLRACRRVLRSGGRTGYFLIHPAPDLSAVDHRRALRLGPPVVTLDGRTVPDLTTRAGFVDVVVTDLSDEFRDALASKRRAAAEVDGELRQRFGDDVVDHLDRDRVDTIAAVEDGVLRRSRVVAIAA
jgi:hypothetical protein